MQPQGRYSELPQGLICRYKSWTWETFLILLSTSGGHVVGYLEGLLSALLTLVTPLVHPIQTFTMVILIFHT